jgi:hypothetical protein
MQFAVIGRSVVTMAVRCVVAALLLAVVPLSGPAFAQSAYISQIGAGATLIGQAEAFGVSDPTSAPSFQRAPQASSFNPPPELALPGTQGRNTALTVTVGNNNRVAQVQAGIDDTSSVGILGGNSNEVGIVQGGNDLRSNVALLGTQGLNVGVLQPPGSAPVAAVIARLPNGGLLILR